MISLDIYYQSPEGKIGAIDRKSLRVSDLTEETSSFADFIKIRHFFLLLLRKWPEGVSEIRLNSEGEDLSITYQLSCLGSIYHCPRKNLSSVKHARLTVVFYNTLAYSKALFNSLGLADVRPL